MNKTPIKSAVLLAAGRGKRLRPYTDTTPKPLLPVNGVPTLDRYFKSLADTGVENAVMVVHHLAEQLEQYASEVPTRFGIRCITVTQPVLDGTASALEALTNACDQHPMLPELLQNPFLITATDYLIPDNFIKEILMFYLSNEEHITVSIKTVAEEELASRSSIRFDDNGRILEVVEKPALGQAPSHYSANLTYVLPAEIFRLLPEVPASARGEREVQHAINQYIANGGTARGIEQPAPAEWTPDLLNN